MKNTQSNSSKSRTSKTAASIQFADETCKVLSAGPALQPALRDLETIPGIRAVTEDLFVTHKPTVKYRLAADFFLAVFHIVPKENGIEGFEQAAQNIVENYTRESAVGISVWVLCLGDEGLCLQVVNPNSKEDQRGLITIANDQATIEDIGLINTSIFKEIAAAVGEVELAKKFGINLADRLIDILSEDTDQKVKFVSLDLGWGPATTISSDLPVGISSCFCYPELGGTLSDGLAMFASFSLAGAAGARRAYENLTTVADNLRLAGKNVTLGIVFGEFEALVFSPGRSRDMKIPFTIDRLKEHGWVRNSLYTLLGKSLPRNGREEIDIDQIFQSGELDFKFYELCTDFRLCLIDKLLKDKSTAVAAIEQFTSIKTAKKIQLNDLASNHNLQSRFLAIVDSLVLRTILHRFIEVYHGYPFKPTHDDMLQNFGRKQAKQKHEVGQKRKGKTARFADPYELVKGLEKEFKDQFLALDRKYEQRYGGDIHFSEMAKAVRFLEENIDADHLFELLDLTNQKRYSFHYEDLRPDALENFYQRSLETAILFKRSDNTISVVVENSRKARKELGAYYTPAVAAKFAVKNSLGKLLQRKDDLIEEAFDCGDQIKVVTLINEFLHIRVCDPTVGGGSFLKESFRQFAEPFWFGKLQSWLTRISPANRGSLEKNVPWLRAGMSFSDFENHVLTHCLYGVDIDIKALSVASQTLTLEALSYLDGEEKFPNFININLKVGSAFVSYFEGQADWSCIDPKIIQALIRLRGAARVNRDHAELELLLAEERKLLSVIYEKVAAEKQKKWSLDVRDLKPFCWQIEFPEVFFDKNGKPKENAGFDCIVGNPPWETIKPYDDDFFESIDPEWENGKNNKVWQEGRIAKLLRDPEIVLLHKRFIQERTIFNEFLKQTKQYKLLNPKFKEVRGSSGDANTHKLATELYVTLLNHEGVFGFLVPEGFAGDMGTRDLRKHYIEKRLLESIIAFNENNEIFPDATQAFCILSGSTNGLSEGYSYLSNLKTRNELIKLKVGELPQLSYSVNRSVEMETVPLFPLQNKIDRDVLEKIFKFTTPSSTDLPWMVEPYRELDTSMDFSMTRNPTDGYVVCKGEHMDRFQKPSNVPYGLNRAKLYREKVWAKCVDEERVAWRNIAGLNTVRRMVAAVIPAKTACFHSLNVIRGPRTSEQRYFLVGVLNSFCYEYFIKLQSKNNNMSIYFVKLSPIPRLEPSDKRFVEVTELSKELHKKTLSADKRSQLEAEIEAKVAKIYGFTLEEFEHIVATFERVPKEHRQRTLLSFAGGKKKVA
jgi:Alw26I/Eco31I/Esp3I family type II restriction m6 adenine DNA methyltransferase